MDSHVHTLTCGPDLSAHWFVVLLLGSSIRTGTKSPIPSTTLVPIKASNRRCPASPQAPTAMAASSEAQKPAAAAPPRDFFAHLEAYLARRDGVDKLLKISRYAARLALAAGPPLPPAASARLKSFESSVGLSRKAFRLGKFVQSVNALRAHPHPPPALAILAYGGEGVYYFVEQFVWLAKAGLLPSHLLPRLQRLSAWAELLGYVGSVAIKLEEMAKIESAIKMQLAEGCGDENDVVRAMRGKLLLKRMSVVQDVADAVMALGDVTDGKGLLGSSTLMASAGLLSALISTHKNWNSC